MRRKIASIACVVAMAGGATALGASAASAQEPDCYVFVHVHTYPGLIWGTGVGVETGEYHPHTDCV